MPASAPLVALLLVASTAPADPPAPALPPSPTLQADETGPARAQPAFLELVVNGVARGLALVHLRGDEVWVAVEDLDRAGLAAATGDLERLAGRAARSLEAARGAGLLTYEVDPIALELRIQAGPQLLARRAVDAALFQRPPGLGAETAPSLFVNYAARWDGAWADGQDAHHASGAGELGFRTGRLLVLTDASRSPQEGIVRGRTAASLEWPERLLRLVAGDGASGADALGASTLVGGVGLVRDPTLDPYRLRQALPGASVFVSSPSTLELRVNGLLVRQEAVAPGTLDLSNLPVSSGANEVAITLRDAFGRTEVVRTSAYHVPSLLAPGVDDFSWWAGFTRRGFGRESFDYGPPALLGTHRVGVTPWLTAGGRLELQPELVSAGPSATVVLPVGELDLALAASHDARGETAHGGAAAALGWGLGLRRFHARLAARATSWRYASAALAADVDRALLRGELYLGAPVTRRLSVGVDASAAGRRDGPPERAVGGRLTLGLGHGMTLLTHLQVGRTGARTEVTGTTTLVFSLGARTFGQVGGSAARESSPGAVPSARRTADATITRPLPAGTGLGYRLAAESGPAGELYRGVAQAQTGFGRYEATVDALGPLTLASASAAGAVVVMRGGVFAARPVEQGFAAVRVPGVEGVRVRLDGREVGRTDAAGALLVPGLLAYYGHRLSIEDTDVPITHDVRERERAVAAPARGGADVVFDVVPLRAVTGLVVVAGPDGDAVPAHGALVAYGADGPRTSPIGEDGRFWIEGLEPGTHPVRVEHGGGACLLLLAIPADAQPVHDVRVVRCRPE